MNYATTYRNLDDSSLHRLHHFELQPEGCTQMHANLLPYEKWCSVMSKTLDTHQARRYREQLADQNASPSTSSIVLLLWDSLKKRVRIALRLTGLQNKSPAAVAQRATVSAEQRKEFGEEGKKKGEARRRSGNGTGQEMRLNIFTSPPACCRPSPSSQERQTTRTRL